jgi:hypothetical protein
VAGEADFDRFGEEGQSHGERLPFLPAFFCPFQQQSCSCFSPSCDFFFFFQKSYPLRPIILFANIDVSRYILVIDIFVLAKSNMDRREYCDWQLLYYFLCPLMQEFLDMLIDTDQNE